jgi:hypothetical protein
VIIAITIGSPCGAGVVAAGVSDEVGTSLSTEAADEAGRSVPAGATDVVDGSLSAVVGSAEDAEDSGEDSVHPTVRAATAPATSTTRRVVGDKRMIPLSGYS